MAHQTARSLVSIFGWVIWGDLGQLTIYRNRKAKMVAFTKTWPKAETSALQETQRARFTAAAAAWQALTPETRAQWHLATRRASLCAHGYDLWVHWHTIGDEAAIRTLERQTSTTLLP